MRLVYLLLIGFSTGHYLTPSLGSSSMMPVPGGLAHQISGARKVAPVSHQFDVVSLRPSKSDTSWRIGVSLDDYHAIGVPLWRSILKANFPPSIQSRELIQNAPDWVWNDPFDFIGTVGESDLSKWQEQRSRLIFLGDDSLLEEMLRNAIQDRCGLSIHRVPAKTHGYALVVGKGKRIQNSLKSSASSLTAPPNALAIQGGGVPTDGNGPE